MTPFPSVESHAVRSPEILGDLTLWGAGVELGDRTGDVEERFLSDQFSAGTQMSGDVTVLTLRYVGDRQAAAVSVHSGREKLPSHSVRASQSRFLR